MLQVWTDWKTIALSICVLLFAASLGQAQTLTVALSGNSVNFNLAAGRANNPGSTSITVTTTCACLLRNVDVYAYFSNGASALNDGLGDSIPSSSFEISANGGGFNALTNNTPFGGAGAGMQISNFFVIFPGFGSPHNDVLNFNIDLSSQPLQAPGTYNGTLTIRAQSL
jgi:hypothetical protein